MVPYRLALELSLSLVLAAAIVGASPSSAQEGQPLLISQSRPKPPPRLPPNRTRPGGGLDPAKQACQAEGDSIIALVPQANPVLSASRHPTFLFYLPDTREAVESVEFSLLTVDEKQRIFSTRFNPNQIPGVVMVKIPEEPAYALDAENIYRWYLKVYCRSDSSENDGPLTVDGWVNRVDATAERQTQVNSGSPEVWYDSLALVANHLETNPNNTHWRERWLSLLQSIGLEDLAAVRITGVTRDHSGARSAVEF